MNEQVDKLKCHFATFFSWKQQLKTRCSNGYWSKSYARPEDVYSSLVSNAA